MKLASAVSLVLTLAFLVISSNAQYLRETHRDLNPGEGQGPPEDNPDKGKVLQKTIQDKAKATVLPTNSPYPPKKHKLDAMR